VPNWEYAAIVKLQEPTTTGDPSRPELPGKWRLVGPGKHDHAPRISWHWHEDFLEGRRGLTEGEYWVSPIGKNYWEFNDNDEAVFDETLKEYKQQRGATKVRTEARSRKIHFEAQDILTLINIAGKEGWEITGGIGKADGVFRASQETRYRAMRREI